MRRRTTWRPAPATPGQVLTALTLAAIGIAGGAWVYVYSWGFG